MGNQFGTSGSYLPKPVRHCTVEEGSNNILMYCAASMQGWRKAQEDRFTCITDYAGCGSFFGVYDGHGGSEIAEYLKIHLHCIIEHYIKTYEDVELALYLGFSVCDSSLTYSDVIGELNDMLWDGNPSFDRAIMERMNVAGPSQENEESETGFESQIKEETDVAGPSQENEKSETDLVRPITGNIVDVAGPSQENDSSETETEEMNDENQQQKQYLIDDDLEPSDPDDEDYVESESSEAESDDDNTGITAEEFLKLEPGELSGSTATAVIVYKSTLYVANVGDSRCVLSRRGQALDLTVDHKPEDPEEHCRITAAGGSVSSDGRVQNCLNLSRAFGDHRFKNSFIPQDQIVCSEPYIYSVPIEKDDEYLIIASDGLWNSVTSQDVVDYISIRSHDAGFDMNDVCEELFNLTIAPNMDNDGTGCDNMTCILLKFTHSE